MEDAWESGDPYEVFMGRWSSLVAQSFVDRLSLPDGLAWLDVGCGSGALSQTVLDNAKPRVLTAVDQSAGFVETAQQRLGYLADCRIGSALSLPVENGSFDVAVSGLMLNFIPEPERALAEMRRVVIPGGTVAVYIWDYAGTMEFLNQFWDAATALDPGATALHEGRRFPDANSAGLKALFDECGFVDTTISPITINTHFLSFDDYWRPFLGGQGPAPTYLSTLEDSEKERLRDLLYERLPVQRDGSISLVVRAWAARGQV